MSAPASTPKAPITVVVPAFTRTESLLETLDRIKTCVPVPNEILVHVDGASDAIVEALERRHPDVVVYTSPQLIGPGGGRDLLIRAAKNPLVATFDDDSYPESPDFFRRVLEVFRDMPDLAVLAANVLPEPSPAPAGRQRMAEFIGCGCIFSQSWYLQTTGFVPRPVAYGMEEADLSLQLHALGGLVVRDADLRVVHESESHDRFGREFHEEVTINTIMLPFLRYPWLLFPLVLWHLTTRLVWEVRRGWTWAAITGVCRSPVVLCQHLAHRKPVPFGAVLSWHRLKRSTPSDVPIAAPPPSPQHGADSATSHR